MMWAKEFLRQYSDKLNITDRSLYVFINKHAKELTELGIVKFVDRIERSWILVLEPEKLCEYIQSVREEKRKTKYVDKRNSKLVVA